MKFEETYDFDYSVDVIFNMFTDQDYFLTKYERISGRKPELIDCRDGDDTFSITVRHVLDAALLDFPDIIAKRIGNKLTLRQTDAWHYGDRTGRIDIDMQKSPVEIMIDMRLTEAKKKAKLVLAFDIRASIPLIGNKVEKAVAGPITHYMKHDLDITNEMAADYAA